MLADVSSSLTFPLIAIIVGGIVSGVVITVVSMILSARRDKRKEEDDEIAEDRKKQREEDRKRMAEVVQLLQSQVAEVHVAMLGAEPTAWNPHPPPGVVKTVDKIEGTLFGNGGNSLLDRMIRLEKKVDDSHGA